MPGRRPGIFAAPLMAFIFDDRGIMLRSCSLHIGINRVGRHYFGGDERGTLRQCHADADLMADIARTGGGACEPVVLRDEEATCSRVIHEVEQAAEYLSGRGTFLWTFSGHGTQIPPGEEGDGNLDEGWVLYDGILLDNDIRALLAQFSEQTDVIVVSDCCYSGDMTQLDPAFAAFQDIQDIVPRAKLLDFDLGAKRTGVSSFDATHTAAHPVALHVHTWPHQAVPRGCHRAAVLDIGACADNQIAGDGAFTPVLYEVVCEFRRGELELPRGYEDLIAEIRRRLPSTQQPRIASYGSRGADLLCAPPFQFAGSHLDAMNTPTIPNLSVLEEASMSGSITFNPAGNSSRVADASIAVTSPGPDAVITTPDGSFNFAASVTGFGIGSEVFTGGTPPCALAPDDGRGGGQHIYLIIDNDREQKLYTDAAIVKLGSLSEGPHTLRAYLSRSWEESLKGSTEEEAFSIRNFYYNTRTGEPGIDRGRPILSCNAPVDPQDYGPYVHDQVILDFFTMFGEPGSGYSVEVELTDGADAVLAQALLNSWEPYCITGLPQPPPGATHIYHLRLRLMDNQENPVPQLVGGVDLNTIHRTFHVERETPPGTP